jgi:1,4-alpha-glucan branching enzyme
MAFLRVDPREQSLLAVIGHFTPVIRSGYRLGLPRRGRWRELINTNSQYYGGSGLGNHGGVETEELAADGFEQSVLITMPPLSTTVLKWTPSSA